MLKIITWTTKFSLNVFHQSQRWLKRLSCWKIKFLWLKLRSELRVSPLLFKRFIRTSLIRSCFRDKKWQWSFFSENASLSNTNLYWATLVECCCMSLLVQFTPKVFSRKRWQHKQLISSATPVADEIINFWSWIWLFGSLSTGLVQSTDEAIHILRGFERDFFTVLLCGKEIPFEASQYMDRESACFPNFRYFRSKRNETFWINVPWFDPLEKRAS